MAAATTHALRAATVLLLMLLSRAGCPYARHSDTRASLRSGLAPPPYRPPSTVDFAAVSADIKALLTQSKEAWPADFGNYGPFFVRLAWHCTGSYRRYRSCVLSRNIVHILDVNFPSSATVQKSCRERTVLPFDSLPYGVSHLHEIHGTTTP